MEDDCEIPRGNLKKIADAAADLQGRTWDFVYFGHIVSPLSSASSSGLLPFNGPLQTAHLYAINGATLEAAIDYLESCLKRPPGHPLGGPMHLDGALTMFRAAHPEMQTWIAQPSLAFQRSSRSDITYRSFELAPGIRQAITFARLIKRGIRAIRR
jgi:hypothetical protein